LKPDEPLASISGRDVGVPSIVFTKIGNRSLTPFPDAFGLIWKKEEMRALNPEENGSQEHGRTAVFKPADLRGFRNGADIRASLRAQDWSRGA
jgi:hypothetical protein